jgi:hypothetical protein
MTFMLLPTLFPENVAKLRSQTSTIHGANGANSHLLSQIPEDGGIFDTTNCGISPFIASVMKQPKASPPLVCPQ